MSCVVACHCRIGCGHLVLEGIDVSPPGRNWIWKFFRRHFTIGFGPAHSTGGLIHIDSALFSYSNPLACPQLFSSMTWWKPGHGIQPRTKYALSEWHLGNRAPSNALPKRFVYETTAEHMSRILCANATKKRVRTWPNVTCTMQHLTRNWFHEHVNATMAAIVNVV